MTLQHSVSVCRTCPRYAPNSGTFGRTLVRELTDSLFIGHVSLLMVACLGACRQPGAVAFDAPHKARLRFAGLDANQTSELVAAIDAYITATPDSVAQLLSPVMRTHLSAVSPKYHVQATNFSTNTQLP